MNVISLNVNGIRKKRKRLALERVLDELHISICVATETHLRKKDLKRTKFKNYTLMADFCRNPVGKIGGGSAIIVSNLVTAETCPFPFEYPTPYEGCCAKVFPKSAPEEAILITGMYISPKNTRHVSLHDLLKISGTNPSPDKKEGEEATTLSHIITGDFNTTTWSGLFEEWCQTSSAWTLVNPRLPTITTGSCIDKMMLIPGQFIPATFFPPDAAGDEDGGRGIPQPPFYPAEILPDYALSSHFPLLVQIPAECPELAKGESKMTLDAMSEEQWAEKNLLLMERLQTELPLPPTTDLFAPQNWDHFYSKYESIIKTAFADHISCKQPSTAENALYNFLTDNSRHSKIDALLEAIQNKDAVLTDKFINIISVDNWRAFIQNVSRMNSRQIYAYLAGAEGRKIGGTEPSDLYPIVHEGVTYTKIREKGEVVALAFHKNCQQYANTETKGTPQQTGMTSHCRPSGKALRLTTPLY